tara:strand:- start:346 stop:1698 length:1353 start_codon:yes stop_codon:yes gene_type:complete
MAGIELDGVNQKVVLDADGDTYLEAATDDTVKVYVAGAEDLRIAANAINVLSGTTLTIDSGATITNSGTASGFSSSGAQTGITSVLNAGLVLGRDADNDIDFSADNIITFRAAAVDQIKLIDNALSPVADSDVDLGTSSLYFKDAYIDTITTTGAITTAGVFTQDGGAVFNEASAAVNFRVETDDITHMLFVLANKVGINEDTPEPVKGLTINSAEQDGGLISLKSSDVAHGITDLFETDTYGSIGKQDPTGGALNITGLGEGTLALRFLGVATNVSTNHSTGAEAPINLDARIKSGTGQGAVSADANLLRVTNGGANRFIIDEDGDIFHDGSASAFDTYDDAHLIRAHDLATSSPSSIIQSKFDDFLKYKKADLKKAGILDNLTEEQEAEGQVPFVNLMKLQKLHNGAIWQQYEKTEKLTHAMYELAKEAIGKRKADAILDKHEVKLLN